MSHYTDSEITKLRREIQHNRKEIDGLIELLRKDRAEIERLQVKVNSLFDALDIVKSGGRLAEEFIKQKEEIERLRADLDECYQDLLTETIRANTAEERNDRLQAVVGAAKAIYDAWPEHIPHPLTELGEALAALEDNDGL